MRSSVDLPQPDGPTTTTSSLSAMSQVTPCTTSRSPNDLRTASRVTVVISVALCRDPSGSAVRPLESRYCGNRAFGGVMPHRIGLPG